MADMATAAQMVAEAMLRTLGGEEVTIEWPMAAVGDATNGLATAAGTMQQATLGPAVVRRIAQTERREVVVTAEAAETTLGASNLNDVRTALLSAAITVSGESYRVTSVDAEWYGGEVYIYRIGIE